MNLNHEEEIIYNALHDKWCVRGEFLVLHHECSYSYELNKLCKELQFSHLGVIDITEDGNLVLSVEKAANYFKKKANK